MSDPAKMFADMMAQGQSMLRAFNPALESFTPKGFEGMTPLMPRDMMEAFFGNTFNKDGLDARTRMLVALAGLVAQGAQAEPLINSTVRHALEAGATQQEIAEVIYQMSMLGGLPAMTRAMEQAQAVFAETEEKRA